MGLGNYPAEIWYSIGSYLDSRSLISLSSASPELRWTLHNEKWRKIVDRILAPDPSFFEQIRGTPFNEIQDRVRIQLNKIKFEDISIMGFARSQLEPVNFNIEGYRFNLPSKFFSSLNYAKNITINKLHSLFFTNPRIFVAAAKSLQNLLSLNIEKDAPDKGYKSITGVILSQFFKLQPNLRRLKLNRLTMIDHEQMRNAIKPLTKLISLQVSDSHIWYDDVLDPLIQQNPELECLDVECVEVKWSTLIMIMQLENLRHLRLSFINSSVDVDYFRIFLASLGGLRTLEINKSDGFLNRVFDNDTLTTIRKNNPKIEIKNLNSLKIHNDGETSGSKYSNSNSIYESSFSIEEKSLVGLPDEQPATPREVFIKGLKKWLKNENIRGFITEAYKRIITAYVTESKELDLSNLRLTSLPVEIGQLTWLRKLYLKTNRVINLPIEIGKLTLLTELDLNYSLQTTLPAEIGQLTSLEGLNLDENSLTSLPAEIGQLKALKALSLKFNQLTSLPAEIGDLPSLLGIDLSFNRLNSLPAEIGYMTTITHLNLENNMLTNLPDEFGKLTSLTYLNLSDNPLKSFRVEVSSLSSLTSLNLNRVELTTLPGMVGNLTLLKKLDLGNNKLKILPSEFGQLTSLKRLDLRYNKLDSLPGEFVNQTLLKELDLGHNKLTTLPDEFGNLTSLKYLGLPKNKLTSLSKEIGNMTSVTSLALYDNQLSALPVEIGNMTSLRQLRIERNSELCELPLSLGNISELTHIDIKGTKIPHDMRDDILKRCKALMIKNW